jgi:hypothetical protein
LSSEEYEPDAWLVKMRKDKGGALTATELLAPVSGSTDGWTPKQLSIANRNLSYFFDFSRNTIDSSSTSEAATTAKAYNYGHVPEVTVNADGTASIKKQWLQSGLPSFVIRRLLRKYSIYLKEILTKT